MTFSPAISDEHQLAHVHPDLVKVVRALFATSPMPFRVLEGARTKEQQRKNIEAGVSWTMNSRHIPGRNGYAHAVDLAPLVNGDITWDWAVYRRFAPIVCLAVAGLAALAVVAFFIAIGNERRERLWDGMVGGLTK